MSPCENAIKPLRPGNTAAAGGAVTSAVVAIEESAAMNARRRILPANSGHLAV
jgi:hypothetical protein